MSEKIEISRELAERLVKQLCNDSDYEHRIAARLEVRALLAAPAVERQEPVTCDAINEENAPTFMGEPNPQHSINWYRGGISKHWKTICRQRIEIEAITKALRFYADKDHYSTDDALNWDSVSGEPMNILWHEEQPWFIEDGSVARTCLDNLYTLPGTPVSTWTTTDIATADADGLRNGRASVVMPEKRTNFDYRELGDDGYIAAQAWNACLDKFKELNK